MSLRVLVVEDSAADRTAARRALERDPEGGWEVEAASSAEEGLARIDAAPPDVVLVDFHLPGMTGMGLLRELRARARGHPVPAVVMLTGSGNERVAVEAMKAGAQDYLVKDGYTAERLRRSLRAAVDTVRMTRELEARREQAERAEQAAREALAVRDELFALATHDLKGPLQIISLNAQLLRRQARKDGSSAGDARLEHILRASHRMSELIDHFLEMTRGEVRPLHRERLDLRALASSKVHALEASARHRFILSVDGDDFAGDWDAQALERVLENLLGNAVKYSPPGTTVTVRLAVERGYPADTVRLEVSDEGIGIPAGDLPFVFERFRRGSNVAEGVSGSGVGLASVRRMVELHGGTLHVESQEGRGSTFTVRLPRSLPLPATGSASGAEQGG
ncbi:MAG TPA: hybrid sensor histidine kinase/response regulator [Myxococcus sp.]|jgi:signal transduction histidine kinase|nr:hybrid sensor histidine kinase/response regulator [Myxococcus sp.]